MHSLDNFWPEFGENPLAAIRTSYLGFQLAYNLFATYAFVHSSHLLLWLVCQTCELIAALLAYPHALTQPSNIW